VARDDLDRVRDDLDAIRAAAGLDNDLGSARHPLRACSFAAAGLVALAWAGRPRTGSRPPRACWPCSSPSTTGCGLRGTNLAARVRPRGCGGEWRQAGRLLWLALPLAALQRLGAARGDAPAPAPRHRGVPVRLPVVRSAVGERGLRPLLGWANRAHGGGPRRAAGRRPVRPSSGPRRVVLGSCSAAGPLRPRSLRGDRLP